MSNTTKQNEIKKDDYIEGYEETGISDESQRIRKMRGWVNTVFEQRGHTFYEIQADDHWGGARNTLLSTEQGEIKKLDPKPRPVRNR